MVIAGVCLVLLPALFAYYAAGKERPLDPDEVRWLRRLKDRIHQDEILPYQ
ncbi:MAG TPA: hypothetical protein VGF59_16645 [Bryobacteraceae bacterium]|jgi:hypothetical protein